MCSLLSRVKTSCKTRLLRAISWWGVMFFWFLFAKPIKRVIKESFLLFLRDKLILHKVVRSILFELFWLLLKFLNHRFLSMSCDSLKTKITLICRKKTTCFWLNMLKVSLKKIVSNSADAPAFERLLLYISVQKIWRICSSISAILSIYLLDFFIFPYYQHSLHLTYFKWVV